MEADVRKRILSFLEDEQKTTVSAFAKRHGENQSKMSKQLKFSTTISLNTILLLLDEYKDLSAEWLLRGTGEMFITDKPAQETPADKPAKITLELEVGNDNIIKMRLKDKVIQLAE